VKPEKHGRAPTSADRLLAETRRYAVLTAAQELAIATRAARGDRKARHLLVLHNLRFAHYVARQYRFTGLPHGDVLSAVYTGMLTAAARFDPARGVHFVTYATPLIRTAVRLLVIKAGAPLSLPHARTFAAFHETASLSFDVPMRAGDWRPSSTFPLPR
jgi:DNA-directed RNA polymerase sigma subunit (sigma70/sigma32)